jgi:hypothetical protein
VRFLACDFWNGSDAQCDLFQQEAGITFPVLLNAGPLGEPNMFNCSYHYVIVVGGNGIVEYRGFASLNALEIVLEAAIEATNGAVAVGDVPGAGPLLGANYPNPFNPSTVLPFRIPADRDGASVQLDVLDMRGRVVRSLVDERRPAGEHTVTFDGLDARGRALPSGTYLARLLVDGERSATIMTLVK